MSATDRFRAVLASSGALTWLDGDGRLFDSTPEAITHARRLAGRAPVEGVRAG